MSQEECGWPKIEVALLRWDTSNLTEILNPYGITLDVNHVSQLHKTTGAFELWFLPGKTKCLNPLSHFCEILWKVLWKVYCTIAYNEYLKAYDVWQSAY